MDGKCLKQFFEATSNHNLLCSWIDQRRVGTSPVFCADVLKGSVGANGQEEPFNISAWEEEKPPKTGPKFLFNKSDVPLLLSSVPLLVKDIKV